MLSVVHSIEYIELIYDLMSSGFDRKEIQKNSAGTQKTYQAVKRYKNLELSNEDQRKSNERKGVASFFFFSKSSYSSGSGIDLKIKVLIVTLVYKYSNNIGKKVWYEK